MGLLLKNLNVGELTDKLGLDDKVADVLENLVDQLESLSKDDLPGDLETLIAKAASLLK